MRTVQDVCLAVACVFVAAVVSIAMYVYRCGVADSKCEEEQEEK